MFDAFAVFIGESGIDGGTKWAEGIQKAVLGCEIFIPVCSPGYGASVWTERELALADNKGKTILPFWHSGEYPPTKVRNSPGYLFL